MTITVFIADDHAVIRDGLRFLLGAQHDIEVIGVAADGRKAVDEIIELQPDIVILDINMPGLNGIEVAHSINDKCPSAQIIILSVHVTSEYIYLAFQAGVRAYLLKETAGVEIIDAVRAVHDGQRYLSQKISEQMLDDYVNLRESVGDISPLESLSPREREVLKFVVEGKASSEIAEILSLSPKTVETYRVRIMRKLDIHDLPTLVKFAIQHGVTSLE